MATRAGRAPVSNIWCGAVKDQVEPCKASAGADPESICRSRTVSGPGALLKLPDSSPLGDDTFEAAPSPLYRWSEYLSPLGSSGDLLSRHGRVRYRLADTEARRDRAIAGGRHKGSRSQGTRRERQSPEPGHLMGGELGDDGGGAQPGRSRWTGTTALARDGSARGCAAHGSDVRRGSTQADADGGTPSTRSKEVRIGTD